MAGMFFCSAATILTTEAEANSGSMTSAKAAVVMEVSTGMALYSQNENQPLPIASTAKILKTLVILENCDINVTVKIPQKAVGVEALQFTLWQARN